MKAGRQEMPQFRKRKLRKDLDLSACDPVGYFNGENGNMNLCFMNAGLQLLLHAMRDLAHDLNRCNEPVALSLREWVEAVLECGRTYTPGTTPKYVKNSPKYTLVGGGSGAGTGGTGSLLLDGPQVSRSDVQAVENEGMAGRFPLRALRQEKSEKLRLVLSDHLRIIAPPAPGMRQAQCDSYEFLEAVLEKVSGHCLRACSLALLIS